MKSPVYFIPVVSSDTRETINAKLKLLLEKSKVLDVIQGDDRVAVKVHFGEEGNTAFVKPEHVRVICDAIGAKGAKAFLTDTNTLYRGRRTRAEDHLALAHEHGFTEKATGVNVLIPDEANKENIVHVPLHWKHIQQAKVARLFIEADALVASSHFKGHMLTGFGGALKNIGMGCATREGKLMQHCDVAPAVYPDKCVVCGACEQICPTGAIRIEQAKPLLDRSKCIGCANCVGVCPSLALFVDMGSGDIVQSKMVEYVAAVLKGKENKVAFINFAINIRQECDCWGMENPRIGPDVGILASRDPVSIDQASFDLVNKACGKDVFREAHPDQNASVQLQYAQELGLGRAEYELIC
jgi:uncharacterized protein